MLQKIRSNEYEYKFIYPAQILGGKPLLKSKTLTIEYATSDFIFAERIKRGNPALLYSILEIFHRKDLQIYMML